MTESPAKEEHGWWWTDAIDKAEKIVEELGVPWDELGIEEEDITDGNLTILSEKLARISYYIVQTNNRLTRLVAIQSASKESLDHAVNRLLASGDDIEGVSPKPSIDARRASLISLNDKLRDTKIQYIESSAIIRALENVKESLDVQWKTVSRIMSARLAEPIDR